MSSAELTIKAKIGLILFGVLLAAVLAEVVLSSIATSRAGREFGSLAELRRAMLNDESKESGFGPEIPDRATMKHVVNPHPSDQIIYDLKPNLSVNFAGKPVRTNSCGMRQEEVKIQKPSNTYRIAFLGDSFVFGWGVEEQEGFVSILEDNLNMRASNVIKFQTLNFGVPGYSTFQEVAVFKERVLDFSPDAVVVFFVENDFEFPFWVRDISDPNKLMSGFELARLFRQAVNPDVAEQSLKLKKYDPVTALMELNSVTRDHGIKLYVAVNPRKDWRRVAKKLAPLKRVPGIVFIEMRRGFETHVKKHGYTPAELSLPKDPHPSPIRHRIYADLMTPYFLDAAEGTR